MEQSFLSKLTCMKNIIRTCNLIVKFSKFTLNIEIYEKFGERLCSKICPQKILEFKNKKNIKI